MSSLLFPLDLRGAGSPDVEALSSYIYRLAIAHGVSAWTLLHHARAWYCARSPTATRTLAMLRNSPDLAILVRPNELTLSVVDMLGYTCGNDSLFSATFLALKDALDRCVGTFSKNVRWCRGCMSDFIAAGDPGYYKLSWHLSDVSHCAIHRLPLVDRCSKCESLQRGTRRVVSCTACFSCGAPLSEGPKQKARPSWSHEGDDLFHLVGAIGVNPKLRFAKEGVRKVLAAIFDQVWARGEELRFYSMIPRDECLMIIDGDIPISLTTARKLAFRLGIPLVDLLSGIADSAAGVLNAEWTAGLPSDMRPKTRLKRKEREALLAQLNRTLTSAFAEQPVSLKALAREIDVSVGCLHYHFPQIAKDVIRQYEQWRAAETERKARQARAAALAFFRSEQYAHEAKSKKHALRVLMRDTGLPKNLLRKEIAMVVDTLIAAPGYTKPTEPK